MKKGISDPQRIWQIALRMLKGIKPSFYCGSGVTACHNILARKHAGYAIGMLYVGSWSHWITDPERPVG